MNLTAYITQKTAERDRFYCPCCKDRYEPEEMDIANDWPHSEAMRARYGGACCNACTDDHVLTADGVLMRYAEAVVGYDHIWSTQEAFDDAKRRGRE